MWTTVATVLKDTLLPWQCQSGNRQRWAVPGSRDLWDGACRQTQTVSTTWHLAVLPTMLTVNTYLHLSSSCVFEVLILLYCILNTHTHTQKWIVTNKNLWKFHLTDLSPSLLEWNQSISNTFFSLLVKMVFSAQKLSLIHISEPTRRA